MDRSSCVVDPTPAPIPRPVLLETSTETYSVQSRITREGVLIFGTILGSVPVALIDQSTRVLQQRWTSNELLESYRGFENRAAATLAFTVRMLLQ